MRRRRTLKQFKKMIDRIIKENEGLVRELRPVRQVLAIGPDGKPTFKEVPRCPE